MIKIIKNFENKIYNLGPNRKRKKVLVYYDDFSPITKQHVFNIKNMLMQQTKERGEFTDTFCLLVIKPTHFYSYKRHMHYFNMCIITLEDLKALCKDICNGTNFKALEKIAVYRPQINKEGLYSIVNSLQELGYEVQLLFQTMEQYRNNCGIKKYKKVRELITHCNILNKNPISTANSVFENKARFIVPERFEKILDTFSIRRTMVNDQKLPVNFTRRGIEYIKDNYEFM